VFKGFQSISKSEDNVYYAGMRVKKPMVVIVSAVAMVFCLVILCSTVFKDYSVAFGWHLRHGNHTVIRGYRVPVPIFWWREDYFGGNIGLVRAAPRTPFLNGRSLMWYEDDGAIEWWSIADSQRVLTDDEAFLATKVQLEHPTFSEPKYSEVIKLITLKGHEHTLFCVSEETRDFTEFSMLDCRMAGSPVIFRYSGNPNFEKTAERIFSTMQ
jgi:hypothetical protein